LTSRWKERDAEYSPDIGNGFVGKQKLQLPVKGKASSPNTRLARMKNYHTYTVTVTPAGKCKKRWAHYRASIKVKKFADNTADSIPPTTCGKG
jgi:hypothetical protein